MLENAPSATTRVFLPEGGGLSRLMSSEVKSR